MTEATVKLTSRDQQPAQPPPPPGVKPGRVIIPGKDPWRRTLRQRFLVLARAAQGCFGRRITVIIIDPRPPRHPEQGRIEAIMHGKTAKELHRIADGIHGLGATACSASHALARSEKLAEDVRA